MSPALQYMTASCESPCSHAAASSWRGLSQPVGNHDEDPRLAAAASIARLAGLDFETAGFGHGRTVTVRARQAFSELAEKVGAAT